MRQNLLTGIMIFVTCGFSLVFSQAKNEDRVVLSELIEEALRQNPRIRAAKIEWEAAQEKVPQAKALPDPMLSYSYFGQSIETRLGPQRNKFSLSQRFPFFGKQALRGEVAQKESSLFEQQYYAVKADVLLELKKAFYSLYWYDKAIRINQQEKEVLKRLAKIAEKSYETGQASQQDVLKAQLEITKTSNKMLILRQGRQAVVDELNVLLNRDPEYFFGEVGEVEIPELELDLEHLFEWSKKTRPEMVKSRLLIDRSKKSLALAKKNFYPDFSIMVDYIDIGGGTTEHPKDGRNSWMASIGINIPLWRKKLHAAEAEAALRVKASEHLYQDIESLTLSRIRELFLEVKTIQEQVDLYKFSLLPQSEQSFKASEAGYLAGKVDFLNLLDSERMILMIKNGYFKAIADLGKSLAELERVVGKDIHHFQIKNEGN